MARNKVRSKASKILKGVAITGVLLLGFFAFASIEAIMTGSNLDNPGQMRWWLLLNGINLAVVVSLIKLILWI